MNNKIVIKFLIIIDIFIISTLNGRTKYSGDFITDFEIILVKFAAFLSKHRSFGKKFFDENKLIGKISFHIKSKKKKTKLKPPPLCLPILIRKEDLFFS
ncbi:hypothetical protein BpHYR1_004397 [Brachionus plicatilis]|uniref:Uncharacterized protein n=1 Tax=Brachionus plicatilis TaxID=10195 RepID=A0A3M7PA03_BRAPC|nr:hypothetical protein BpHYR1_004397 [Brachionus plicatilis]